MTMTKRMMGAVTDHAVALGFKRRRGNDTWVLNDGEVIIGLKTEGRDVVIRVEDLNLEKRLKRPLASDFLVRLRKRIGQLRKTALRTARTRKRLKKELMKTEFATSSLAKPLAKDFEPTYYATRQYNPMTWCTRCRKITRENLMANAEVCQLCATEAASKRRTI